MRQIDNEKKRAILAIASSMLIIASIVLYAVFTPGLLKPSEVTITGTVTAQGLILNKIAFTNTGCGTRKEAVISSNGGTSGTYKISLDNEYYYNVSIVWNNREGALVETEIDVLVLDSFIQSLVRDWVFQP
ncbi:hypothetical protein E2P63_01935 [Candidatus Bathyarchaeota archaeon]|nr:hypothetical protein E2P63_01935 [Candidatus Bathyarchaeota archaeon]